MRSASRSCRRTRTGARTRIACSPRGRLAPRPGARAPRLPPPRSPPLDATANRHPAPPPAAEARYRRFLLAALAASTFFEGFDATILGSVAPYVARDFGLGPGEIGLMLSFIGVGAVLAFAITMLGDRIGRRRLLLVTVAGYGIGTGLTALATDAITFAIVQFVTRMFLFAELAVALVMVAEEMPPERRGFGVSIVIAANLAGAAASAFALRFLVDTPLGWRALYVAGLLPVLIVVPMRFGIRETARFAALDADRGRVSLVAVWQPPWRRSLLLCIALFGLIGALTITFPSFYPYFLVNERGFTPAQVSTTFGLALLMGLPAVPLAGWLLDRWGRRVVGVAGPLLGMAGLSLAFTAQGSQLAITLAGMAGLFVGTSILPIQATYVAELFPTHLRSLAASWITNGAGRAIAIASPALTGYLALRFGSVGAAAVAMSLCGLLAAALVYFAMPETKGQALEETAAGLPFR